MHYRENKQNGDKLSILGYGCMRLPQKLGVIDMEKTEQLIMQAISDGVNFFDTAFIYVGSEAALGTVLEKNNVRDKVFVSTKLPGYLCKSSADFDKYLNTQLSRLKTDYIDYYFIHMLSSPVNGKSLFRLELSIGLPIKKQRGLSAISNFLSMAKETISVQLLMHTTGISA